MNLRRLVHSVAGTGIVTAASLLILLACTGCHGGTAQSTTDNATASPVADSVPPANTRPKELVADQDPRPRLICFGDSLTAGYGTDPGQAYPDYLQKLLDQQGYHYHVVNAGVSGNTTKDGLERIHRVLSHHPQIVVVEFGGNDGLRGLPLEQTEANLDSIIDQLQKAGATVAIAGITLPPDYGADYIQRFNAMYPMLAKKYHVRMIPFLLDHVYGVPGDMQGDQTHATAKGNQQVARNVEKLVLPLLKK